VRRAEGREIPRLARNDGKKQKVEMGTMFRATSEIRQEKKQGDKKLT
jgi:hypothetical protein